MGDPGRTPNTEAPLILGVERVGGVSGAGHCGVGVGSGLVEGEARFTLVALFSALKEVKTINDKTNTCRTLGECMN